MLHIKIIGWVDVLEKSALKKRVTAHNPGSRELKMRELYCQGITLNEIGEMQNPPISRERVRQLLKKHFGITGKDGGKKISALPKQIANERERLKKKISAKEERIFKIFGCNVDKFVEINGSDVIRKKGTIAEAYYTQRNNSINHRKIGWEITFPEWWEIWKKSGKWEQRGPGKGYCMTRIGDTGPYSFDNVEIKTIGENFSESYIKHPWEERFKKSQITKKRGNGSL